MSDSTDDGDVVPPRPAARRQPGPARRPARPTASLPLFVLDPALWGPAGPSRRAYLAASLRGARRVAAAAPGLAVGGRGDPVARWCGGPCGRRARRCTSPPTSGRTAAAATTGSSEALAEHGIELVRTGSPYAVAPGPGDQGRRRRRTRSTRRSRRPGPSTAGGARSTPRAARTGWRSTTPPAIPAVELPGGHGAPRGRRGGRAEALAGVPSTPAWRRTTTDRDRPDLDRTSRMSVHLKWGEIHPRTMLADLDRGRVGVRCDVPQGAGLAGVLRRRAVPAAGDAPATTCAPEFARMAYDEPGGGARRRGARGGPASRSSTRGCASCGRGLDAQPGADDRGQLPGQGPARGVAARRAALPAAGWSTATWRRTSTAGSGWPAAAPTRRRTSGSSTRSPRAEVRPGRRVRPALGAGAGGRAGRARTSPARSDGYPAPIVDHAEERREALDRLERIKA